MITQNMIDNMVVAGYMTVDSGQAMIGDPCYLDEWKPWNSEEDNFEDHVNKVGEYGYLGACNATLGAGYGSIGNGRGIVFSTGWGDGMYPVYVHIDSETGRPMMAIVDFDNIIQHPETDDTDLDEDHE